MIAAALEERIALMAPSRRLRMAVAERSVKRFAEGRPLRVLDAGCADGLTTLALAKRHPEWSLVGMDLRDDLLAGARERARNRGLANVDFVAADLTRPLPEGGFDAVMALECLTEIPDDRAALGSLAQALHPGGLFVVQVPDERWKPLLPGSSATWRDEVRHGYDAEGLREALRHVELEQIEIVPTYHAIAMAAQEIRDRIKDSALPLRLIAFPLMLAAVRLELWGVRLGQSNALLARARSKS